MNFVCNLNDKTKMHFPKLNILFFCLFTCKHPYQIIFGLVSFFFQHKNIYIYLYSYYNKFAASYVTNGYVSQHS